MFMIRNLILLFYNALQRERVKKYTTYKNNKQALEN